MLKHLLLAALCIAPVAQATTALHTLATSGIQASELQVPVATVSVQQSTEVQSAVLENINRFNGYEQTAGQVSRSQPSQNMQLASEQDKVNVSIYTNTASAYKMPIDAGKSGQQLGTKQPTSSAVVSVSPQGASRTQFDAISALIASTRFNSEQKINLIQILSH